MLLGQSLHFKRFGGSTIQKVKRRRTQGRNKKKKKYISFDAIGGLKSIFLKLRRTNQVRITTLPDRKLKLKLKSVLKDERNGFFFGSCIRSNLFLEIWIDASILLAKDLKWFFFSRHIQSFENRSFECNCSKIFSWKCNCSKIKYIFDRATILIC